jgi:hypothetical protein
MPRMRRYTSASRTTYALYLDDDVLIFFFSGLSGIGLGFDVCDGFFCGGFFAFI